MIKGKLGIWNTSMVLIFLLRIYSLEKGQLFKICLDSLIWDVSVDLKAFCAAVENACSSSSEYVCYIFIAILSLYV